MPRTPLRTVVRASPSSAGSFQTAPSLSDPFQVLETRNPPENGFSQPNTLQAICPETPHRTFHMPSPTHSLGDNILSSPDPNPTPTQSVALTVTPHRGVLPRAVSASPLQPFPINCPEMVYERYLRNKVAWLVQHPDVDPEDYRIARGLPIFTPEVLQNQIYAMPAPQVYDAWRRGTRWTDEEIYAWLDHHQALEDNLVEEGLATSYAAGRLIKKSELLQVQAEMLKAQETEAFNAMRYLN